MKFFTGSLDPFVLVGPMIAVVVVMLFAMLGTSGIIVYGLPVETFLYGFPFGLLGSLAWGFVWHFFIRTNEGKRIDICSQMKKPIIEAHFDNGFVEYKEPKEILSNGTIICMDGWVGTIMRVTSNEQRFIEEEKEEDKVKAKNLLVQMRRLTTKLMTLRYARIPILVCYAGKAVLTNVPTISTMEYAPDTSDPTENVEATEHIGKREIKVLWPVDGRTLKAYVPSTLDQTLIDELQHKSELLGGEKIKKLLKRDSGGLPWVLIIAAILLIAGLGLTILSKAIGVI